MNIRRKIPVLGICLLIAAFGMGQVRKILTQEPLYNALNRPSQNQTNYSRAASISAGALLPDFRVSAQGCSGNDCQDVSIRYEVPGFVMLDRLLLASNIQNKIGALLDQQQQWQSMNSSQASDQTKQEMYNLLQNQINNLQGIQDNLQNGCQPVDFKSYSTHINADVRYNDPVSGSMGLMRANGSGDVNVSDLFNGVPYSALDASPVKATVLIYKK
jgi:hypothetical protein